MIYQRVKSCVKNPVVFQVFVVAISKSTTNCLYLLSSGKYC